MILNTFFTVDLRNKLPCEIQDTILMLDTADIFKNLPNHDTGLFILTDLLWYLNTEKITAEDLITIKKIMDDFVNGFSFLDRNKFAGNHLNEMETLMKVCLKEIDLLSLNFEILKKEIDDYKKDKLFSLPRNFKTGVIATQYNNQLLNFLNSEGTV